jgi:class 3 adenylate cyclase
MKRQVTRRISLDASTAGQYDAMPPLRDSERAKLPDRAFAYVDSRGRRRLPINDAAHVRAAFARFNQVTFEDEAARDRARERLLKAAKKHGILPVGFIAGQLRAGRKAPLPSGSMTLLLADIEGSTALLRALGESYTELLGDARRVQRSAVRRLGGHEVDVHGDEFFAVFRHAPDALLAALAIHRGLRDGTWPDGHVVRVRIGLHAGRPTLTDHGYVGLAVHAAARIMSAGHGGQVLLSHAVVRALGKPLPAEVSLRDLGIQHLRGIPDENLYQAVVADLPADFPPLRTGIVG